MDKGRLEAFSDGVMAVIITIMVLELKAPQGESLQALLPLLPSFLVYVLSYVYAGIYWNNHHHMLHACRTVTGPILWANLHLLFWLSLIPFTTAWMGQNHFAAAPSALYGIVLLMCAIAYRILQDQIIRSQGAGSILAAAVGNDRKGTVSAVLYIAGILCAFRSHWISQGLYALVMALWLIPDRRIERILLRRAHTGAHPPSRRVR
jgi:uncharacterized membrane protein